MPDLTEPKPDAAFDKLIEDLRAAVAFDYTEGGDGYNKSAAAMSQAALAAFNWAARKVGATGFQASWAALHFYGEALGIKGPFMMSKVEDALYPQYDLAGKLDEFIRSQRPWLAEQATERLAKYEADPTYTSEDGSESMPSVHPRVVTHWRELALGVNA